MNKNDFNRFIGAGLVPGGADLDGARELTGLFPWFHSAQLVLLRGLRESSDIKFESQLKASALYVADRSMLYHYLFMNVPESAESVQVAVTETVLSGEPEAETETPVPEAEQVVESQGPEQAPEQEPVVEIPEPLVEIPEPQPQTVIEIVEPLPVVEIHETEPEIEIPETEIETPGPQPETVVEITDTEIDVVVPEDITEIPVLEPEAVITEEPLQETPHTEEPLQETPHTEEKAGDEIHTEQQFAEDASLKSRDELIAEIEARLVELEKEDLLELAEGDEITVDSVPVETSGEMVITEEVSVDPVQDEAPPEMAETEEIVTDPVADESPEVRIAETDELKGPEAVTGPEESAKQLSANDLIDRFIQTSPRIERMVPGEVPLLMDLAEHRTEEHTPFITETLARIYVNQGYYTRAINIYEKLTLQFPEKSAYFASRIEKIKELIK